MPDDDPPISFSTPACDNRPMWDIWLSGFQLPALTVADELKLFPYLQATPGDAEDIATRFGLSIRATEALVGLLAATGFLVKRNGVFHLTEISRHYLLPDSAFYWGGVLHTVKSMPVTHSMIWSAIHNDRTGEHEGSIGDRFTDDWRKNHLTEDMARSFTAKMHSHAFASAIGLSRTGEFNDLRSMLDMGGGSGCYSIALASTCPETRFTVADLPLVCKVAEGYISDHGFSDRIDTLPLDMFRDSWPDGYGAIFFSDIFHDWSPDTCMWLAQNSLTHLPPGGHIYLHEVLLDDDKTGPVTANAYSLAMLAVTEGQQFTAHELEAILQKAGFLNIKIRPSYGYYTLISAQKPE